MEDEEEAKILNDPSLQEVDGETEFADSRMVGAMSSVEAKDDEAASEEETPTVDTEAGTGVEMKSEVDSEEGGVQKSVSELDDSQFFGDKTPNAAEDVEAVAEGEIPTSGTEMKISVGAEQVESGLGKSVPRLDDSQLVGAKSPVTARDDEAAAGGYLTAGTEMEMKCEAEGVEGSVSKSDPGLNESQLVGVQSRIGVEVVVEEIPRSGTEMESENVVEAKIVSQVEGSVGNFVSDLHGSQLFGAESTIAAKEDEDEDKEAMAEEETGMEDMEMEARTEVANEVGTTSVPQLDNSHNVDADALIVAREDEDDADDDAMVAEDETPMADTEMDVAEMAEAEKRAGGGGKRKRGKNTRVPARLPARKTIEEDVCFICFDGGDLVLCDRRGCPKAYHPSCVNRDEAFFRAKGRWNCGWHLCSICEKNAHYMCYTCTFSLCKVCIKDAVILCVRGNKGFCETCMKTVTLIENNEQGDKEGRVDFDDKGSWEYLFKDYWIDLKAKLSLSSLELAQAKNSWKGSESYDVLLAGKQESPEEVFEANNDHGSGSESSENLQASKHKRRKAKRRSKSLTKEEDLSSSRVAIVATIGAEGTSIPGNTEWASKELLEFVMHMKNGEESVLSQFDVQALLLEYIKRNKLRDPRRKSQIICDARLENLFGKARVGHFEMLKLLESHFLVKEDSQIDDIQGTVVNTEANQLEADGTIDASVKGSKDRRRKMRKKGDDRGPQSNLNDYAAIDMHNINLIYLRRKLVEDFLEDMEKFHDKVVGTFVRIRISGSNQKHDMYRLVQVVGMRKGAETYKVGKKTTDLVLEILNLSKTEVVSIDTISNQEFTEDECKRLRQSIKCGLINRLTVGDILEKAMEVQAARVNDWLETEIVRLSHLRDRASEKGRKKELRECVEKLQLLKTPEERRRRLEETPEIHADPNMDPSYESEENDSEAEDNKQETYAMPRGSGFSRKGREPVSPRRGSFSPMNSWSGTRKNSSKNWEMNRNISNKDLPNIVEEVNLVAEIPNENAWNPVRDKETNNMEKVNSATNSGTAGRNAHSLLKSESFSGTASETSQASLAAGVAETATKINETEKIWHYQDPSGKVQGPFSLVQLRKWNNTGYFPVDLRIWKATEKQDDSILLMDALAGRFQKSLPPMDNNVTKAQTVHSPRLSSTHAGKPYEASLQQGKEGEGRENHGTWSQLELSSSSGRGTPSAEVSNVSADKWGSDYIRNDSLNLPSPTPIPSTPGSTRGQASDSKLSSSAFPVQQAGSVLGASPFPGGNGPTHSPAVATYDGGQLTHFSTPSSINQSGSKEHVATESLGVLTPLSVSNSGRELMRSSENDSSNSLINYSPVPYSEQGIMGSTTALPTSQTIVTSESNGIQPSVETQQWGSGSVQNQEMVAPSQGVGSDSQAWGGPSSQMPEPNPSLPMPVQPAAYGHWSGIPSTVQNPIGNFSTPGFSPFPQPDPWRHPVAGNQSNIQAAAPPSVPWVMGVADSGTFVPGPRPDNTNPGWGLMQVNPNMGWGGPALGTMNMNWGAPVQGPVPGTVNPGWVASTGNPAAMVQGLLPGNVTPGWGAQTGNPGSAVQVPPPPGNGNPGWVAPPGNPGFNVQGQVLGNVNPVWVPPTGNPGTPTVQGPVPGNENAGWVAPAGNTGMWGNEKQRNGGDRFLGQRDRGFQGRDSGFGGGKRWNNNNRQSSFGSGGQRMVCPFHQKGHCKKGASCDHLHT